MSVDRELEDALRNPIQCECPTTLDPTQGDRIRQPNAQGTHCLWCGLQIPNTMRTPSKYRIVIRKTINGVETIEDLGLFEAFTSNKARERALAQNAERFGFKRKRDRTWFLNGWSLQRSLHKERP